MHNELLAALVLGDVTRDLRESAQPPAPVAQSGSHYVGPEPRSVLAYPPAFFFASASLPANAQFGRRLACFHILRRVEAAIVLANDFVTIVALDAFGPG